MLVCLSGVRFLCSCSIGISSEFPDDAEGLLACMLIQNCVLFL